MEIKTGEVEGLNNPIDTKIADWNEGQTWKVEEFPHWVWVYGVTLGTTEDKVYFTGNNFLPPLKVAYDEWLVADANGVSTHLPWRGGIHKDEKSGKFISTSEMVWKWKQYDPDGYDVNGFPYYSWDPPWFPIIFTRYYDGSP
jgi:hypothetical protein